MQSIKPAECPNPDILCPSNAEVILVDLMAPEKPLQPMAAIFAPLSTSECVDLEINPTRTKGGAGRALQVKWVVDIISGGIETDINDKWFGYKNTDKLQEIQTILF